MWHSKYTCGGLWGHQLDDSGYTHEMYLQQRDPLPDKQVSNRRTKKDTCLPSSKSLIDIYPLFLSSSHDEYVNALSEGSKIISKCWYTFLLHHDVIFKFTTAYRRLQKISHILHQYTGISRDWVALMYPLS